MSENNNKSREETSVSVLKDVHQNVKKSPESTLPDDGQPSAEEAAEQLKGSDADVDRSVGFDDQPDSEEAKEQEKGTD